MEPIPTTTTLCTARCELVYPAHEDKPYVWSASRVPGFNEGMTWDPPTSEAQLEAPLLDCFARWAIGDAYTWSMWRLADRTFIGRFVIRREQPRSASWSIGYWVHPDVQGQGYAQEGAKALVEFGFSTLRAPRLVASCAKWNVASAQVLRRIGLLQTGETDQGFIKHGEWVPEFEFALERADYVGQSS